MCLVGLRIVVCGWCQARILLCSRCDRGKRYCCDDCREKGRTRSDRKASQKYARSERGRESNRQRQSRFRARHPEKSRRRRNASVFPPAEDCDELGPCQEAIPPPMELVAAIPAARREPCGAVSGNTGEIPERGHCHGCGREGLVIRAAAARGRFRFSSFARGP